MSVLQYILARRVSIFDMVVIGLAYDLGWRWEAAAVILVGVVVSVAFEMAMEKRA